MVSSTPPPRMAIDQPLFAQLCSVVEDALTDGSSWIDEEDGYGPRLNVFDPDPAAISSYSPVRTISQTQIDDSLVRATAAYTDHPHIVAVLNNLVAGLKATAAADIAMLASYGLSPDAQLVVAARGVIDVHQGGAVRTLKWLVSQGTIGMEHIGTLTHHMLGNQGSILSAFRERNFSAQEFEAACREIQAEYIKTETARQALEDTCEKLRGYYGKVAQAMKNNPALEELNTALARFKDNPFAKVLLFGVGAYLASHLLPSPADTAMAGAQAVGSI